MTRDHDIERVLDHWFTEGPTQMPNRFLDDTLERIDRVPQHRLARLQTRLLSMYPNLRFAAVAAVIVAVAGLGALFLARDSGVGRLPQPAPGVLPAPLLALWRSAGTRVVPGPGPGGVNTYSSLDIVINPTSVDIQNAHTDVVSSVSLVAADRLELRALTMGDFWHCKVGDAGTYSFSISTGDQRLSMSPVSDTCVERATILAGDWTRTDLGELQPGRRDASTFRPFLGGTGRLTYTVPAGWAGSSMRDNLLELGRPSVSDEASISVISNAYPSDQAAPCSENRGAAGLGRTPAAMAAWLRTVRGLVVSTPAEATIGGLSGIIVDLSIAPGWTTTCAAGLYTFSYSGSDSGGDWSSRLTLKGTERERLFLLDRGDGTTLVIDIEAPDDVWNAFIADATPVVDSFEFSR